MQIIFYLSITGFLPEFLRLLVDGILKALGEAVEAPGGGCWGGGGGCCCKEKIKYYSMLTDKRISWIMRLNPELDKWFLYKTRLTFKFVAIFMISKKGSENTTACANNWKTFGIGHIRIKLMDQNKVFKSWLKVNLAIITAFEGKATKIDNHTKVNKIVLLLY